ncbi:hypothetical protein FHW79_002654 [Azospirillum sp. OGB3]|uniref:hypothetical protein n=1 Tax=Azospirillum sp. OGB3 TaxID=2587012 RepID=UPI001605B5B0|nr:hypothetical protein [Azospirillum sp. OGB3]MBB3265034.1 hypothetical protein [Azospirillum sp. OGB3]
MIARTAFDLPAGTVAATIPLWAADLTLGLQLATAALGLMLVLVRLALALGDVAKRPPAWWTRLRTRRNDTRPESSQE